MIRKKKTGEKVLVPATFHYSPAASNVFDNPALAIRKASLLRSINVIHQREDLLDQASKSGILQANSHNKRAINCHYLTGSNHVSPQEFVYNICI